MDDENAGLRAMSSDVHASQYNLLPIRRIEKEIAINNKSTCTPVIKRLQFPITLSWAGTTQSSRKNFPKNNCMF